MSQNVYHGTILLFTVSRIQRKGVQNQLFAILASLDSAQNRLILSYLLAKLIE